MLIKEDRIPDDVNIVVLTQVRDDRIRRVGGVCAPRKARDRASFQSDRAGVEACTLQTRRAALHGADGRHVGSRSTPARWQFGLELLSIFGHKAAGGLPRASFFLALKARSSTTSAFLASLANSTATLSASDSKAARCPDGASLRNSSSHDSQPVAVHVGLGPGQAVHVEVDSHATVHVERGV